MVTKQQTNIKKIIRNKLISLNYTESMKIRIKKIKKFHLLRYDAVKNPFDVFARCMDVIR